MSLMFWRGAWYGRMVGIIQSHATADYAASDPLFTIVLRSIVFALILLGGFELLVLIGRYLLTLRVYRVPKSPI